MTRFEKLIRHDEPYGFAWELDEMITMNSELREILTDTIMRTEFLCEWLNGEAEE